jgi:hypothetical protein
MPIPVETWSLYIAQKMRSERYFVGARERECPIWVRERTTSHPPLGWYANVRDGVDERMIFTEDQLLFLSSKQWQSVSWMTIEGCAFSWEVELQQYGFRVGEREGITFEEWTSRAKASADTLIVYLSDGRQERIRISGESSGPVSSSRDVYGLAMILNNAGQWHR